MEKYVNFKTMKKVLKDMGENDVLNAFIRNCPHEAYMFTPLEAEWEGISGYMDDLGEYIETAWECTNCEEEVDIMSNYCPNCGAKMIMPWRR